MRPPKNKNTHVINEHQDSRINMWDIEMVKDIITNELQGLKIQKILGFFGIKYKKKKFLYNHKYLFEHHVSNMTRAFLGAFLNA